MSAKRRSTTWIWVVVALVAVGAWGLAQTHWFSEDAEVKLAGAPVRRGPLRITVLQHGNLAAKDAISVKSEIEGQATVIYLIAEGTFVKPGDLLVELDASDLKDKKVTQDISEQNAEATYIKAKAAYEIQESQNQSDIEAAERKLNFAGLDVKRYEEGDWAQQSAAADEKIKLAAGDLDKSKETFEWSGKLAERGFLTKTELSHDELDFDRCKVTLDQAKRASDLLIKYDDPRKRIELKASLEEAARGLERTKLQAEARLADYNSGLVTSKSKLDLERDKQSRLLDQLGKAKIYAKDSGMVVYTRQEGGRMGNGEPVAEGTAVRERQEILTIPRTNGLIAEASVHESVLKEVTVGKHCSITVDALPGQTFEGEVTFVALLPDKGSWWANPNARLYRTEIAVTGANPEMRPGMSCSIDIVAEDVPDCLYVPVQSVILDDGKTIAFVEGLKGPERREIQVGRASDKWVEITAGLTEGEVVLLSPPPGFTIKSGDDKTKDAAPGANPAAKPGGAPAAMMQPGAGDSSSHQKVGGGPPSAMRPDGAGDGHHNYGDGPGGGHPIGTGASDAKPGSSGAAEKSGDKSSGAAARG